MRVCHSATPACARKDSSTRAGRREHTAACYSYTTVTVVKPTPAAVSFVDQVDGSESTTV